jgi:hypothetical protein
MTTDKDKKVFYKSGRIASEFFLKCTRQEGSVLHYTHWLTNKDGGSYGHGIANLSFKDIRDLTQDEIDHLEACIAADRYVDPPVKSKPETTTDMKVGESLVGRYVEALVDKPSGGSVLKGEIGVITVDNHTEFMVNFPSQSSYYVLKPKLMASTKYKLLPVGYTDKSKVDEEPIIGEWYVMAIEDIQYIGVYQGKSTTGYFMSPWWVSHEKDTPKGKVTARGSFNKIIRKASPDEIPIVDRPKTPEFKTGDWVVVERWHYATIPTPQICKLELISNVSSDKSPYGIKLNVDHLGNSDIWWFKEGEFRHATQAEIDMITKKEYLYVHAIADTCDNKSTKATGTSLEHQQPILIKQNKTKSKILVV